jgi:hypothetical protein
MMVDSKTPWAIIDGEDLFCRHCGEREKVFPASLSGARMTAFKATCAAFADEHARCEVTESSPITTQGKSPAHWLRGGDTGTSSITLCRVLAGVGPVDREGWPHDPDDFGRCYRFLKLFPHLRPRLPEVAARYPGTPWVAYVREWDRLTELYEEELPRGLAPRLYALMQQLRGEA